MTDATTYNRDTYDRIWPQMSDYITYNPGARHRRRHIFAFLDRIRFTSLLDVGCGNGELLRLVDARYPGRTLTGVDLSAVVVEQNALRGPHMRFAVANVETESLPGPVDVVVCSEVIEHLAEPRAALAHIKDALVPGGHAIVTTPSGRVHATERHFGHVRHFTPTQLRADSEASGLEVIEVLNWGFPFYRLTKWATNLNPEAALERFAGDKPYGVVEKLVSNTLTVVNAFNLERAGGGVQLFALLRRPR